MNDLHSLLKRQIKRFFGNVDLVPPEYHEFIQSINKAYKQFDEDRNMLERSLDLSSQELLQTNSEMRAIFLAFPDLLFRLDKNGTIQEYKAGSTADMYLEPKDIVGKKIQNFPKEDIKQKFEDAIQRVIEVGEKISLEYSINIHEKENFYEARLIPMEKEQIIVIIRNITERVIAENALRESEYRFRALSDTSPTGIFVYRRQFLYGNNAGLLLTGYSYDELLNMNFWDVVHPDFKEVVKETGLARQRGEKVPHNYEFKIIRKDGSSRWINFTGTMVQWENEPAALGTVFDVTDRKNTDEEQRKRSEHLIHHQSALLELTRVGNSDFESVLKKIIEVDAKTLKIERVSVWLNNENRSNMVSNTLYIMSENIYNNNYELPRRLCPEYFQSLEKIRTITLEDVFAANDMDEISKEYFVSLGIVSILDVPIRLHGDVVGILFHEHKGDKRKWTIEEQDFVVSVADKISLALETFDRMRAEAAIKESEERFKSLVENSTDIIFTLDLEGRFTYINPAFEKITNYHVQDYIGHPLTDILSFEYIDLINEILKVGFFREKIYFYEIDLIGKEDKRIRVELNIVGLFKTNESSGGNLGIVRDISDRKQLENQLLQSQKMDAIGRLAGGIAHDFNNILTSIIGFSDVMLLKIDDKTRIRKGLEQIGKEAKRAASLTKQLLAFSRRQIIQPRVLDLNVIVTEILNMLKRLIGEDINLNVILEPDLVQVKADPGQLSQVIMNLVVNSRDAMPDGGSIIIKTENVIFNTENIKIHPEAEQEHYVCLSVTDSGIGMSDEILSHLFEPFFTTKEVGRGTGLGLAVVYGIIKQNQGWIEVKSKPGEGSTFKIHFPALRRKPKNEENELEISLEKFVGHGEKVLLIEDEEGLRLFAKEVLSDNGYIIFEAENANKATEIFDRENGNFQVIFSDMVLPDGNGIDLIEQFLLLNPKLQIVLTTGYADEKSKWSIVQEKGYSLIQKPFTMYDLLKSINEKIQF